MDDYDLREFAAMSLHEERGRERAEAEGRLRKERRENNMTKELEGVDLYGFDKLRLARRRFLRLF